MPDIEGRVATIGPAIARILRQRPVSATAEVLPDGVDRMAPGVGKKTAHPWVSRFSALNWKA
jgi:hypothetical protein